MNRPAHIQPVVFSTRNRRRSRTNKPFLVFSITITIILLTLILLIQ